MNLIYSQIKNSYLLKNKKNDQVHHEMISYGVVDNKHFNKAIKSGITSTNNRKYEHTKEAHT